MHWRHYVEPVIYKGYTITDARPTGGKAGRGRNRTTTLQVREEMNGGYLLRTSIRYAAGDKAARAVAVRKAKALVDGMAKGDV